MAALPPLPTGLFHPRTTGALAIRIASRARSPFTVSKPRPSPAPKHDESTEKQASSAPMHRRDDELDALNDPTVRATALLAPPSMFSPPPPTMPLPATMPLSTMSMSMSMPMPMSMADARVAELAALAHATLDAASFWGDGRRGIARLRFGSNARGGLAGATVTIEGEGDRLHLVVEGSDVDATGALIERLRAAGIDVD